MSPVASAAVRFHQYGEPLDVLRDERVEVADPAAGHVRVRVSAVGLNPADWELCRGFMAGSLPRGIGYDVAGTVDAVGDDVTDVAIGDLVFGTADFVGQPSAGVAEVAILNSWYRVPDGLDPAEAAVLPMVVQTATWTLDALGLEPGTTVLVNGAGAMVGFAAVQIALRRGARVIATAGATFAGELTTTGGPGHLLRRGHGRPGTRACRRPDRPRVRRSTATGRVDPRAHRHRRRPKPGHDDQQPR